MSSVIPKPAQYVILGSVLLFCGIIYYINYKKNAFQEVYIAPFYNKLKALEEPFKNRAAQAEYERIMTDYVSMSDMAKSIFPIDTTLNGKEKSLSAIKDIGIYYWTRNIEVLNELKATDLPKPLGVRTQLFKEYSELNKDCFELMYKAINENSKVYDKEIDAYFKQMDAKMEEINKS
ncbi:MAG: hypothetical protein EOP00_01740 [Pedobacter sp.]|nr:MAG: hypothetical protein EOP00_01740 [Pedobacter sp.]